MREYEKNIDLVVVMLCFCAIVIIVLEHVSFINFGLFYSFVQNISTVNPALRVLFTSN